MLLYKGFNVIAIILRFLFICCFVLPLQGQLSFSTNHVNLGELGSVYEIAGDLVMRNDAGQKIHLLRAQADEGVKVFTSKRTLQPGDTALLVISFIPSEKGKFSKTIIIYNSASSAPDKIQLTGSIQGIKENDLTACYYFGSSPTRRARTVKEPVLVPDSNNNAPQTATKVIEHVPSPVVTTSAAVPKTPTPDTESGPLAGHLPNNIVFLLDISSSMRDSLKLPVMKRQMHQLVDAMREVDTLSLVTYADSVKVRYEAISGKNKAQLHAVIEGLKARGGTKGKRAILFTQELAQKHFIQGGNNMIILASDGKFRFTPEDQEAFLQAQQKGKITLTALALGNDREAVRTLKSISGKGDGSFIHIKRNTNRNSLLEEISRRSAPVSRR